MAGRWDEQRARRARAALVHASPEPSYPVLAAPPPEPGPAGVALGLLLGVVTLVTIVVLLWQALLYLVAVLLLLALLGA